MILGPEGVVILNIPYTDYANWYWIIGDNEAEVYSSKRCKLVAADDAEYIEWKKERGAFRIGSMEEIKKVLAVQGL